jgi:ectoine hydroxylase
MTVDATVNAANDLYPSRVSEKPSIIERKDPVIYTESNQLESGPLDSELLHSYEDNGFLFLESFFSGTEVQEMRDELDRLFEASKASNSPEVIREPNSEEVRSVFAVHQNNEFFKTLSRNPRIVSIIEQLLGSQLYVHQSRINLKNGFKGKEFYWHSDFETWHVEDGMPRMRAISCSIALTDNLAFNGPLMLIPGSHKYFVSCVGQTPETHYKQSLRSQEFGVPDPDSLRWLVEKGGIVQPTGPAGSVILFECNTMHGSNSNIAPYPRSNVFMVYNSVENRIEDPYSRQDPRPAYVANRNFESI